MLWSWIITLYMEKQQSMNQHQWKEYVKGPKENRGHNFFYYRNLAQKFLGYKRKQGLTIHHLRDTEEQRNFNDLYYERWGIDFDGEMKYCILLTTEEHKILHHLSEETKQKIAQSVSKSKTKYTPEQLKERKRELAKTYTDKHKAQKKEYDRKYYQQNKEKIKTRAKIYKRNKKSRQHYSEKTE